jgi:lysosomal acid lipase/cholesteryl ester hydrolase
MLSFLEIFSGNTYGLKHKYLSVKDEKFWDFSWDEMALHDLPSMINYVLDHTKLENLYYVGHSQGTMMGFSGFSINKDLASKIKLFIALGSK